MSLLKLIFAYINIVVPAPSEEWELQELSSHDKHYLIVHKSGKWFEKVVDKQNRPLYISNSDSYRYLISWQDDKAIVKYKAPNAWKWVKLN